jgi:hypothetical protein
LVAAIALLSLCAAALPALAATHETAKIPTTTTLTVSTKTIVVGHQATLTAKIAPTPKPALGFVTFYYVLPNGQKGRFGSASLSGRPTVIYYKTPEQTGKFGVYAVYSGWDSYKSSTSKTVQVTVVK